MRPARRWCRATSSAYRSRASSSCPAACMALTADAAAASASRAATSAGEVPAIEIRPPAAGVYRLIIGRAVRYADGIIAGGPTGPLESLRVGLRPPALRLGRLGLQPQGRGQRPELASRIH